MMQAREITRLMTKITVLEQQLERYTTRKDSSNSSLPPSKDENRPPRTSSLREKGGRKAGGQPGHDGNTLKMTANPDEIVEHRACFCSECGKDVSSQPFELFGKKHWFWTWQNNRATYIAASDNRGTTTINENMNGISNEAVLVHDCWKAHFQTPVGNHQLCTAHLERETKYLEERYKADWPVRFRAMLIKAHKLKKQLVPSHYYYPNQLRSDLENELECLLQEPLDPTHKEMISFQKRIIKYRDHVFTFLYHPDVPADNNGSERAIRNVKVKQKISGQFKILSAAENFAILRSIIDTAIKNKQNVVGALSVIAAYKRN